jgi:hypothetical protein
VELAKLHYDCVCVMAGCKIGDETKFGTARENGFLAQLLLRSKPLDRKIDVVWPFRNFDTSLKIMEQRDRMHGTSQYRVLDNLWHAMHTACDLISEKYEDLTVNCAKVVL